MNDAMFIFYVWYICWMCVWMCISFQTTLYRLKNIAQIKNDAQQQLKTTCYTYINHLTHNLYTYFHPHLNDCYCVLCIVYLLCTKQIDSLYFYVAVFVVFIHSSNWYILKEESVRCALPSSIALFQGAHILTSHPFYFWKSH